MPHFGVYFGFTRKTDFPKTVESQGIEVVPCREILNIRVQ